MQTEHKDTFCQQLATFTARSVVIKNAFGNEITSNLNKRLKQDTVELGQLQTKLSDSFKPSPVFNEPSQALASSPAGLRSPSSLLLSAARNLEITKSQELESETERVKKELLDLFPKLGMHKIEKIQQFISHYYKQRFNKRNKAPKYGNLNKGFTEAQIQAFFRAIDNDKYRLLFGFMSNVGLRIGEVVRVNMADINFQTRELKIKSEKTNIIDISRIPIALFEQLKAFTAKHKKEIDKAHGYVFFKEQNKSHTNVDYLNVNYARRRFRAYVVEAGLNEVYDESDESKAYRTKRKLHILTTHSLRHYAITKFYNQTKNWLLTSKFARHIEPNTTTTYIHTDRAELYSEVDKTFTIR